MTLHERLRQARKRLGLTLEQVAEQTSIGLSSLSEYENSRREPSYRQLTKLGELYHVSMGYFFGESELPAARVLWRRKPLSPFGEETEARFLELCRWYRDLEEWAGESAAVGLGRFGFGPGKLTRAAVGNLACRVRDAFGLGNRPGLTLLSALEDSAGVKVFHLPLDPEGNAAAAVSDEFGAALLLDSRTGRRQRNFDLARELYRLLTWEAVRRDAETSPADEEASADRFAAHLLLPTEPFLQAVAPLLAEGRLTFTDLFEVARRFAVPIEAVLVALVDIYRWPDKMVKSSVERCKALGIDKEEVDVPASRPAGFCNLAIRAYRRGEVALGRMAQYLGVTRHEARERYMRSEGEDEEVKFPGGGVSRLPVSPTAHAGDC